MKNRVRIIAPAGRPQEAQATLEKCKTLLSENGFIVSVQEDIFSEHEMPYNANTREKRLKGLKDALLDPTVDIIMPIRGGYGCIQIAPDLTEIKPAGDKVLVGFSDITILHHLFNHFYNSI